MNLKPKKEIEKKHAELNAMFGRWKKSNGYGRDEWDESRNGPLASRPSEKTLGILFLHEYTRPDGWNSRDRWWRILLENDMDDDGRKAFYVRCDQLNAGQFDALFALAMRRGDASFDGVKHRVLAWFIDRPARTCNVGKVCESADETRPLTAYPEESGMFAKTKYADDDPYKLLPLVLRCRHWNTYHDKCFRNTAYEIYIMEEYEDYELSEHDGDETVRPLDPSSTDDDTIEDGDLATDDDEVETDSDEADAESGDKNSGDKS